MAEESKTYVFGSDNNGMMSLIAPLLQQRGIDPNLLLTMRNGNFGGDGSWFMWIFFLIILLGYGNNGFGGFGGGSNGTAFLSNQIGNDAGRELLQQAIAGNQNAINQLANSLNTSVSSIQSSLNAMGMGIQNVGSQVGMSSQAVINAIQSGNCSLANQFAQCCCENKLLVTQSNYESQIATLNQTNQLGSQADRNNNAVLQAIANQTTTINEHFCDLEKRELTNRIAELTADRVRLQNEIVVLNQNGYINQQISAATATLAADIEALKSQTTTTNA